MQPLADVDDKGETLSRSVKTPFDKRIYFIGLGAVGKLIAHSLTDIAEPPPMTLLFHRRSAEREFQANGRAIEILRNGLSDTHQGFDSETLRTYPNPEEDTRPPIWNLVVGTKAPFTVNALQQIKHRLGPQSSILLIQNGMGLVEELNTKVFPDLETRPQYIAGIVSHGAINRSVSCVEHTAIGNITMTALSRNQDDSATSSSLMVDSLPQSTRYLLRTITRTPLLGGLALPPQSLFLAQLEKLSNNCVINPLTALFGCLNGELGKSSAARVMRLLLAEISLVIRAMPELQHIPGIHDRFSPAILERNARILIHQTKNNQSSMLQDMNKGLLTEINYLNGYIFRRGEELGIRAMVNYTVMSMVVAKSLMSREGSGAMIPLSLADNETDIEDDVQEIT